MAQPKDTDEGFVPFDVGKAGASASINVHMSRLGLGRNEPRFVLLMIRPPKEIGYIPDADKIEWWRKFDEVMDSLTGYKPFFSPPYDNQLPGPHKGVKLHVVWTEKESGKVLKDNVVIADSYRDAVSGRIKVGTGYSMMLGAIDYRPGNYVATITALEDDIRFDGTFRTGIIAGYIWK